MKRIVLASIAGVMVLSSVGCVDRAAQQQSKETEKVVNNPVKAVSTASPTVGTVTESAEITGDVIAGQDTTIGSKQTNRVTAVYVKDGDPVTPGQLLATLDETSAIAQLKQAQAQVATASANLASARTQVVQATRNATVGPRKSSLQVLFAQSQVRSAQRNYDKLVNGSRPEEKRQAEASLASAKATLDLQQKQLDRIKRLVDEGALPGQNLDQQQAAYDQALAQYKSAKESVNLSQIGSRQEDIDSARAALQSAKENLRTAEEQKKLDPLLNDQVDAAKSQVAGARAQLESAMAQIQIAQQALSDTKIYAPFAGKVSGRPIQTGTVVGPNTALVRIVGGSGIYFNGQVPSDRIEKAHQGDVVQIKVDGSSERTYSGRIVGLNPQADSVGRLFSVRVEFTGATEGLRPGMFARGSIAIRTVNNAILVPTGSIVAKGEKNFVFTVEGTKAKQVPVTLGLVKGDYTQVTGIEASAKIVVNGQEALLDGSIVSEKDMKTASLSKTANSSEARG